MKTPFQRNRVFLCLMVLVLCILLTINAQTIDTVTITCGGSATITFDSTSTPVAGNIITLNDGSKDFHHTVTDDDVTNGTVTLDLYVMKETTLDDITITYDSEPSVTPTGTPCIYEWVYSTAEEVYEACPDALAEDDIHNYIDGDLLPCYAADDNKLCGETTFSFLAASAICRSTVGNISETSRCVPPSSPITLTTTCRKPCQSCNVAPTTCDVSHDDFETFRTTPTFDRCSSLATPECTCSITTDDITLTGFTTESCNGKVELKITHPALLENDDIVIMIKNHDETITYDTLSPAAFFQTQTTSSTYTITSWQYPINNGKFVITPQGSEPLTAVAFNLGSTPSACDKNWIWYTTETIPTIAPTTITSALASSLPSGWSITYGAKCTDSATADADYINSTDYQCVYLKADGTTLQIADTTFTPTIPCTNPTQITFTPTQCTNAGCSSCTASSGCTAKWDTTDITLESTQCDYMCSCGEPTNFHIDTTTTTSPLPCGTAVHVKWDYTASNALEDQVYVELFDPAAPTVVLREYMLVDGATTNPVTKITVKSDLSAVIPTFTFDYQTSSASLAIRLKSHRAAGTPTLSLDTTKSCVYTWSCGNDLATASTSQCTPPTSLTIASAGPIAPWSIPVNIGKTATCGSDLIVSPPTFVACIVKDASGQAIPNFTPAASSCPQATKPVSVHIPIVCEKDKCHQTACKVSCRASLQGHLWNQFTNCPISTVYTCGCSVAKPSSSDRFNCDDTINIGWNFGSARVMAPDFSSPNAKLIFFLATDPQKTIRFSFPLSNLNVRHHSFIWHNEFFASPELVGVAVRFVDSLGVTYTTSTSSYSLGELDCRPRWACQNPTDPQVYETCSSLTISSSYCEHCQRVSEIPLARTDLYGCFEGKTRLEDSVCVQSAANTLPLKGECKCKAVCSLDLGDELKDCDSLWNINTKCGGYDYYPGTARQFLLPTNFEAEEVPCSVGGDYYVAECNKYISHSVRLTLDNLNACFHHPDTQATCLGTAMGVANPLTDMGDCWDPLLFCNYATFDGKKPCGYVIPEKVFCRFGDVYFDDSRIKNPDVTFSSINSEPLVPREKFQWWFESFHPDVKEGDKIMRWDWDAIGLDSLGWDQLISTCINPINNSGGGYDCTSKACPVAGNLCWKEEYAHLNEFPGPLASWLDKLETCPPITDLCPNACTGAAGLPARVSRTSYCQREDGFINPTQWSPGVCSETTLDEYSCTGFQCVSQLICSKPDESLTTISRTDLLTTTSYNSCNDSNFSNSCYLSNGASDLANVIYNKEKCTYNKSAVSLRHSQCSLQHAEKPNQPLPPGTSLIAMQCAEQPVYEKAGCRDYSGCAPSIENLALTINGQYIPTTVTTYKIALSADQNIIEVDFDYIGPMTQHASLDWAYKLGSKTADTTKTWFSTGAGVAMTEVSSSVSWKIPHLSSLFNFYSTTVDPTTGLLISTLKPSVDIYLRVSLTTSTDVAYVTLVLTIERDTTCESNPTLFNGINEKCVNDAQTNVATLQCINTNEITSNSLTPTGKCSRNVQCDAQTPICQNDGFRLVSKDGKSCETDCTCPNGHDPSVFCSKCTLCPLSRGVARDSKSKLCGCESCHQGFYQSPDGICSDCSITGLITILYPSQTIIDSITSSPSQQLSNEEYLQFQFELVKIVAALTSHPLQMIKFSAQYFPTVDSKPPTAVLTLTFIGDCTELLASKRTQEFSIAMFDTLATSSTSLKQTAARFKSNVNGEAIRQSATFMSYSTTSQSTISADEGNIQAPDENPVVTNPVNTPKDVSPVVIIVPIVVGVVVLAGILALIYFCCFKNTNSTTTDNYAGESSDSEASASSTKLDTRNSRETKKSNKENNNTAHLELV